MIDIHSHILPGIDDGARSNSEMYNLISEAYNAGFTDIIATSHYLEDYEFTANEKQRNLYIKEINQKLEEENKNIKIHTGSEIYIRDDIPELLIEKKASTLVSSKYILFELPMQQKISNLESLIYSLLDKGYIPIIAHPERYKYVQENPNYLIKYIELGVYLQGNFASIIGYYGKEAKKTIKYLLKNDMIHFLGSDTHREKTIYTKMPTILKKLKKVISEEKIEELTEKNPKLILEDKKLLNNAPSFDS